MRRIKKQSGFTLIELMIVVVIIGILASIAYPQYQEFVRRGKRGDGIAAIQLVLEAQERYYADHLSYTSTASDLRAPTTSPQGNYTISLGACSGATLAQCVQVTATAVGGQAQDGNLVANTRGEKKRIKNGNTLEWK